MSPEDFPDHPAQVTAYAVDAAESLDAWGTAVLKREYEQRRLNESYRYLGPRKPFFPPHLVIGRRRR